MSADPLDVEHARRILVKAQEHVQLLQDVVLAILHAGPSPYYHDNVMKKHREEWPTLWKALDAILYRDLSL